MTFLAAKPLIIKTKQNKKTEETIAKGKGGIKCQYSGSETGVNHFYTGPSFRGLQLLTAAV